MKSDVEFRFSKRMGDQMTAHETGMFRYSSQKEGEETKVAYIHLEALLVKKKSWLILMEYQKSAGTKAEWDRLK